MSVRRNEQTGRFESDNQDYMTKKIIEHKFNSKGHRVLMDMISIDAKQRAEASKK